ncbi:hypothetical protein FAVG1_09363 [Fusarium avenaceum]|nr:hypothetical protein FAVG1_09363 [Fusarium avenaceum]
MSHENSFKVVIAGASVAGLSLANMLQANDIDYVVLEAHHTIAPQVGASIGLLPHGCRILDQLGLYDKVMEIAPPIQTFNFRDAAGSVLAQHQDMGHRLIERHGYPMVFLDRQMLLQILYDNIRDKSKILTNKRVVMAKLAHGGVQVTTADGTTVSGDILVGADGVHSTIRQEMWKLAADLSPEHFDPSEHEEKAPPCDNSCIFGISNQCPGIGPGDLHCVFRNSSSYLVTGGPGGRVYWFRFQRLPKTFRGSDIPRYTDADLEKALAKSADDNILPDLKFSTLVENKVSAVMTPLVEYIYKQWHFGRIITLGDSAHKFHPVGGQGGNAAIESVALLTNNLVKALSQSKSGHLRSTEVVSIFEDVQSRRKPRVALNHRYSYGRARTEALDSPLNKLMALHLLPLVDEQVVTLSYCAQSPGGEWLDMLPARTHRNLIPYKQELLAEPKSRGYLQWVFIGAYLLMVAAVLYSSRHAEIPPDKSHAPDTSPVFHPGQPSESRAKNLSTSHDFNATSGVEAWVLGLNPSEIYKLGQFIQPAAIMVIEGYRGRNKLTPLGLPILWFMLIQVVGLGVAVPLYFAVYTLVSDSEPYWWPLRRFVPLRYARSVLTTCVVGEAVHIGFLYNHSTTSNSTQTLDLMRKYSFLLIPLLVQALGAFCGHRQKLIPNKTLDLELHSLRNTYIFVGIIGALCYWYNLMSIFRDSTMPFMLDVCALPSWSNIQSAQLPLETGFLIYLFASYLWSVQAIWDLRRVGRANSSVLKSAFGILVGNIVFGPGASLAAVWYLREHAMSRTSFCQEDIAGLNTLFAKF